MADENKIEVQIVLDDGSIQKGFVNLQKKAQETGKKVEKSFTDVISDDINNKIENLAGSFGSLSGKSLLAAASIGAAIFGIKKAIDFTLAGEQIEKINAQFDLLTKREGVVGNALREGLDRASSGLIDTEDLLVRANAALTTLGKNAERLPEILELSGRAAAIRGGTIQETFDSIVGAIESGNQKALKNAGIILDTNKVYQDYAKTLGLTASELTKNQEQAALLDAVLREGSKSLSGISKEATPVANSFTRLKVAIFELGDSVAKTFNNTFGESIANFNNRLAEILNPPETTGGKIDLISRKIEKLKKDILSLEETKNVFEEKGFFAGLARGDGLLAAVDNKIIASNKLLQGYTTDLQKLQEENKKIISNTAEAGRATSAITTKYTKDQLAAIESRGNKVKEFVLQNQQLELQAREQALASQTDFEQKKIDQQFINQEKLRIFDEQTKIKLLEIDKTFSDNLGFNEQQRAAAREAILQQSAVNRANIENQANEDFIAGVANTKERLQVIQSGMNQIVSKGAVLFAQALLKGEAAFEDFANGLISVVADQIITLGQALLIQGLALEQFIFSINSLLPGSGAAAAAAGLGLIIFGTALKNAVGAKGAGAAAGAPSFSGGGGVAGGDIEAGQPLANVEPQKPGTTIELNILGNVLDSKESSLQIVQLLNDAFDQQGVTVTG